MFSAGLRAGAWANAAAGHLTANSQRFKLKHKQRLFIRCTKIPTNVLSEGQGDCGVLTVMSELREAECS